MIKRCSEGLSDDVVKLNFKRYEAGRKLKNIAPTSIDRRGDKLHIVGEEIKINQALVPNNIYDQELDYIRALYGVGTDHDGKNDGADVRT